MADPYSVLGVDSSATDDEISKVYKRLARKYHPDLNPGDKSAEQKMKEINAAYEAIKDIRSGKRTYSSYRSDGCSGASGAYTNYGGGYRQTFYGFDFEELFRQAAAQRERENERGHFDLFRSAFKYISLFFLIRFLIAIFFRPFMI